MEAEKVNRMLLALAIILPIITLALVGYAIMGDSPEDDASVGEIWAEVVIDMGDERVFSYNFTSEDATVYGFLLAACSEENANLTVSTSYYPSFGSILVESIGDRSNGDEGKYWQYWVNGEQVWEGADKARISDGDVITWRFEEMDW